MSDRWRSCEERGLELFADEAVFGLSSAKQEQLRALLATIPDFDRDCMQRMAATVHLANVGNELGPLPTSIQQRSRHRALP